MKRTEFKNLIEYIKTASNDDPIWWEGYLFLALTEKQLDKLKYVLSTKFPINYKEEVPYIMLPSGITVAMKGY